MNPDLGSATVRDINESMGCKTRKSPEKVVDGYSIWFDGYVAAADATRIVGRWLAAKEGERCGIVSICGGTVQEIAEGQPFDISGVWTSLDDDLDKLMYLKFRARMDLEEYIKSKQVQ